MHNVVLAPVQIQAVGSAVANLRIGNGGIGVLKHYAVQSMVVQPTV